MLKEKTTAAGKKILLSGRTAAILFGALALILGVLLALELWLPRAIEKKLNAALAGLSEPGKIEFKLLSADRRNARIACTIFDAEKKVAAELPEIRVRYSPVRLLQGRVKDITVSGGSIAMPALTVLRECLGKKADLRRRIPFSARKIQFEKVTFDAGRPHQYAAKSSGVFSGMVGPDKTGGWNVLHYQFDCAKSATLPGWSVRGDYRYRENELDLAGELCLTRFSSVFGASAELPELFVTLRGVTLRLNESDPWKKFSSTLFDFTFAVPVSGAQADVQPIGGADGPTSLFMVRKVAPGVPDVVVDQGFAMYDAERGELEGSGNVKLSANFALPVRFLVKRTENAYTVSVSSLLADSDREKTANLNGIEFQTPAFEFEGTFPDNAECEWKLNFSGSKFRHETPGFRLAAGEVRGSVEKTREMFFPDCRYELKFINAAAQDRTASGFAWHAPEAVCSGRLMSGIGPVLVSEKGYVGLCGGDLGLENFAFRTMPFSADGNGSFSAGGVWLRSRRVGSLAHGVLTTGVNPDSVFCRIVSGKADGVLFGLNGSLNFTADSGCPGGFSATFDAGKQRIPDGFRELIPILFPRLADLSLSGSMSAKLGFFPRNGVMFSAESVFENAKVALPRAALTATGVKLALNVFFPAMGEAITAAGQKFSFETLKIGGFSCGAGQGAFRLDRDGLNAESFSAQWCGGRVSLLPEISPDVSGGTLILDRIELAPFLNQLGLGTFTGQGRISGKLPLRRKKDGMRFTGGAFQSEPDEDGTLKGILRVPVMPSDKERELDSMLTSDTLPDMGYLWLRGSLSSPETGLDLKLEFNGRPLRPLYYEFDSGKRLKKSDTPRMLPRLKFSVSFKLPADEWDRAARFFAR